MNKNVIKAMYECIVAKDNIRPLLMGVHFEKERCYASDTHLLAVYNCGSEKHDGLTIDINGNRLKGQYPPIDRIIPKKLTNPISVDFRQLRAACSWWCKQKDSNEFDSVILGSRALSIRLLSRLLYMFSVTGELGSMTLYSNADTSKPILAVSDSLTVLQMPMTLEDESLIDEERLPGSKCFVSYANLINTYAIESNRPKEKKADPMDWL